MNALPESAVVVSSVGALAGVLVVLFCALGASPARAGEACPNEAIRAEQGAVAQALPDCRAYELVSPPGSVPPTAEAHAIAAEDGQRFAYYVHEPFPGSTEEGLFLLATRGADGWSVQNTTPPQGGEHASANFACKESIFYSAELTYAVLSDGWREVEEGHEHVCEGDEPQLVAGEPRGYKNLFQRVEEDGSYQLIDRMPVGAPPANAIFYGGASSDLSHIVFSEEPGLQSLIREEEPLELYEWSEGEVRPVSLLPGGELVDGRLANGNRGRAPFTHAVSADGETVFFYVGGALYARLHAGRAVTASGLCSASEPQLACTVQVDAAEVGAKGPGGEGTFMYASEDGTRAFFTDGQRLTHDATAFPGRPDLYEYDSETGALADLTVASASSTADVLGFSGASADGSYLYFVAKGVLTGAQVNSLGQSAVVGQPNLYLRHAGTTTFVATLQGGEHADGHDWEEEDENGTEELNTGTLQARVSPTGQYVAFSSVRKLTGYDNEPLVASDCEERCREIFLYDAANGELACVSCAASGEQPTGPAEFGFPEHELEPPDEGNYLPRNVLDDGRVFFATRTPLVPQAINGEGNVYEYEEGSVYLLSNGAASGGSEFLDASTSGSDVFFATDQSLLARDTDNQNSVYDARLDGGFPAVPDEAGEVPACESEEACKPPPTEPPAQFSAGSAALSTGGNLAAPPVPVTPSQPTTGSPGVGKHSPSDRAKQLAKAFEVCAQKPRRMRAACRARARRRFGAAPQKGAVKSGALKSSKGRRGSAR